MGTAAGAVEAVENVCPGSAVADKEAAREAVRRGLQMDADATVVRAACGGPVAAPVQALQGASRCLMLATISARRSSPALAVSRAVAPMQPVTIEPQPLLHAGPCVAAERPHCSSPGAPATS